MSFFDPDEEFFKELLAIWDHNDVPPVPEDFLIENNMPLPDKNEDGLMLLPGVFGETEDKPDKYFNPEDRQIYMYGIDGAFPVVRTLRGWEIEFDGLGVA